MLRSLLHVTVEAHENALVHRDGRFQAVWTPGRYRRLWRARYRAVDLRERLMTLTTQEIPVAEGVSVKVTGVVHWAVADPVAFTERSDDPSAVIYLAAQLALRDAFARVGLDEVMRAARDAEAAASLAAVTQSAVASIGIRILGVLVKDIVLPGDVRKAVLELVTARQRAAVQLEAARAETAALRSLANAAKLLDDHPALARLRMVQSAPAGAQLRLDLGTGD